MGIFGIGGERNFASIVAPLRTIEADLQSYIQEKVDAKIALEEEKKAIEDQIAVANSEQLKSEHTVTKIADLLGADIDGNGMADADEPLPETPEEPDQPVS